MENRLFEMHERDRKTTEAATARYERGMRENCKAEEPDDEGTRSEQIPRVKRVTK